MLENLYAKSVLQNIFDRAAEVSPDEFESIVGVPIKRACPERTPQDLWDSLSVEQRIRSASDGFMRRIQKGEFKDPEVLDATLPGLKIEPLVRDILCRLLECSFYTERNPSIGLIVKYVEERVNLGEPLKLAVTFCMGKSPKVRENKLKFFVGMQRGGPKKAEGREWGVGFDDYYTGTEFRGIEQIKKLLAEVPYPIEIVALLGDSDIKILDGLAYGRGESNLPGWWNGDMQSYRYDIVAATRLASEEFQSQIKGVELKRWQSFYEDQSKGLWQVIDNEMERASTVLRNGSNPLLDRSVKMYLGPWGYKRLAEEYGFTSEEMLEFIRGDVIRSAALYRVEALELARQGYIQCWAERVPDWRWPMDLTNYDGNFLMPTLFLSE